MAAEPTQRPYGGGKVAGGSQSGAYSGTRSDSDATTEPGQYPPGDWGTAIFGGPLPDGTGAPGTRGQQGVPADPTNEPGQVDDGLTGITTAEITETGAPGTGTTPNGAGGGTPIAYTRPGSYLSGTYESDSLTDDTSGAGYSTQANDEGYGSGGPQLPGIKGNEPVPGGKYQPGGGRVLRGGRAVRG